MQNSDTTSPQSWIKTAPDSGFPLQNLPFGIYKSASGEAHACSAIGGSVIDLAALADQGYAEGWEIDSAVFRQSTLNAFISLGRPAWRRVRAGLTALFTEGNPALRDNAEARAKVLIPMAQAKMLLPVAIGDYTDFYSSIEHATNVGTMFRDPKNALLPNWRHIPVGYHGRASSIIVSGTPIHRPKGQQMPAGAESPVFGPSKLLDFELEMAFVVGKETALGDSVSVDKAEEHIFGLSLFNDWSARDIQKWEYVPLGPFLGKSFASSLAPWIITLDALEPFRVAGPKQDPPVLPYLQTSGLRNYDIHLEVSIQPEGGEPHRVSLSNFKYMYWNMCQQLAHHTINGCNIKVGDLCASGTISGKDPSSYGSMLEISWKGTKPVDMPDGSQRKFIQDGDTVIMRGYAEKNGIRIGLGEVSTKVLPAK